MSHYREPYCINDDPEDYKTGICGIKMRLVAERHPLWQPKAWVFECPRCGAIRAIDQKNVDRICDRR